MVKNKENEINKTFEDKENRLNKLNNKNKKIKDYIKENNNELNTIKHKLDLLKTKVIIYCQIVINYTVN